MKAVSSSDCSAHDYYIAEKPPFEHLYEKYYTGVLFYIRKRLNNPSDAEDLAGEVFLYCFDHYDDFDPEKSSVTTWLYMVVNSRLKNRYRDRRELVDINLLENILTDGEPQMERAVYLQQLRAALDKAIRTLPERQQQIVILRYFHEQSYEEIGEQLGLTPGNVRVLMSRALDKLEVQCKAFRE